MTKLGSVLRRLQDRILGSFGRAPADRAGIVQAMLVPKQGERAGYWLQLTIATMLATLGLALSSTAVVIGAMLIAPLMKPLVDLSMGLATGSAILVLRAAVRTIASIAVVVVVAVVITWLLPFHEITPELEARTAPSLLDLAVAAACALAAGYAALRADADIATTAAGTSIGISLVPPLCACGYGLALRDPAIARGAALLFTANLSGILAVAALTFVLAGFGQVDVGQEETTLGDAEARRPAIRAGRAWTRMSKKRLGPIARIVPPLVLVGVVFFPLQHAVGEITHRSQIRQAVAELLGSDKRRVVQYTLEHTASDVLLRVVVVGDARTAGDLKTMLRQRLAELDVESPRLSVWAVPDAASVTALTRRMDELPPPITPEPAPLTVQRYSTDVAAAVRAAWPAGGTGDLLKVWLDLDHPGQIKLTHLGAPLGQAGLHLLGRVLEPTAGALEISEDALVAVDAKPGDGVSWLTQAIDLVNRARIVGGLHACIVVPTSPPPRRGQPESSDIAVRRTLDTLTADGGDVTISESDHWSAAIVRGGCPAVAAAPK